MKEGDCRWNKISLCDEYSLPLDHVNRRRPNSAAAVTETKWNVESPTKSEKVEVVEAYCEPKDSTAITESANNPNQQPDTNTKLSNYIRPCSPEEDSEVPESEEEDVCGQCYRQTTKDKPTTELNSPDSIAEAILPLVNLQSPDRPENPLLKRHPSPYYYSDLYRTKHEESPQKSTASSTNRFRKSNNLETPTNDSAVLKRYSVTEDGIFKEVNASDGESDSIHMPPNRLTSYSCTCAAITDDGFNVVDWDEDEMTRQRHLYETAFDCKVSKSDDDLDEIEKVTNHPVLIQLNTNKVVQVSRASSMAGCSYEPPNTALKGRKKVLLRQEKNRPKSTPNNNSQDSNSILNISDELADLQIKTVSEEASDPQLPLRGFTPSPPSTAPLPTKFPGKDLFMNSIRSAPNLPHPTSHQRIKDLRLPIKSLRGRENPTNLDGNIIEFKGRPTKTKDSAPILEIKGRPRSKDVCANLILEFKGRPSEKGPKGIDFKSRSTRKQHKYSSTESVETSSSGGSMESIRSSTSEGNRSTSSSESRHSTSLSSHSSDSGSMNYHHLPQMSAYLANHANKLHILSPISDKSSQEPVSETSDNNRNNNSQKCSPEEVVTPTTTSLENSNFKIKRKLPPNKNLLNLAFKQSSSSGDAEIQGSDSGISIQSREGVKSRNGFGFLGCTDNKFNIRNDSQSQDLSDLPFDMPKLRRRRMNQQDACTSSSATSVELRDLPFDMPKLRRRLKTSTQPITDSGMSLASSSQSVQEGDRQVDIFRPKLTLNFGNSGERNTLELNMGLNLNIKPRDDSLSLVDIDLPLERQGWYHGAITRVEAECVLKMLREGSFLVRNSESTRLDYSLSLKSARGFMHMRIQRSDDSGQYILGQFSKPFDSIPEMIRHFTLNRLPVRGAEHMCLSKPVIAQLL
ncbi:uncharacterized protein LOC123293222 [Chrysoperla carnea]|uniref:uncharacterized protein LOC123293222 n=1 Tax=Chrysoperla carnea TaxID=189513 RepID=UPI001D063E7B|nr:uncharacterized protein LOC123293222 [Chrysoperla carnea]